MNDNSTDYNSTVTEGRSHRRLATPFRGMYSAYAWHGRREMKAIQLLPAYVKRDIADREAIRDIVKTAQTVAGALNNASKVLDPPMDTFMAMQHAGG